MSLWPLSFRITTKSVCECVCVCVCVCVYARWAERPIGCWRVRSSWSSPLAGLSCWSVSGGRALWPAAGTGWALGWPQRSNPEWWRTEKNGKKCRLSAYFIKNVHPSLFDTFPCTRTATVFIDIIYHMEEQSFYFQCNMFYLCFRAFPATYLGWGVCRRGGERGVGRGIGWRWTDWQLRVPLRLFGPSTVHLETQTLISITSFRKRNIKYTSNLMNILPGRLSCERVTFQQMTLGKCYSFFPAIVRYRTTPQGGSLAFELIIRWER